jgi:hypothetical protein
VVNATPRPLYPQERPGTHCIGGWVGPRAGLDGCRKSRPHRDSIRGPSSPQRVAIPTELSRPLLWYSVGAKTQIATKQSKATLFEEGHSTLRRVSTHEESSSGKSYQTFCNKQFYRVLHYTAVLQGFALTAVKAH